MDAQSRRKTLSAIDPNHLSSIPQPSARKPSRPSQVPQAPYNNPNHQRKSSYGDSRLSYAPSHSQVPPNQSQQRRSSVYASQGHRNSSMGGFGVLSQNSSQVPKKDPRPVRDKQFKDQSVQKIMTYLQESGYCQEVTQRTLTKPTQKEFISIFQYLYHRFDPNFQFSNKKPDADNVLNCLKLLKYPFMDSISKSQLGTAGNQQSWHNILAVLTWMVELLIIIERIPI